MKTIPLTQGKVALVDDELFDALNQFKWSAYRDGKTFYAVRKVRLHHEVFRLHGEEILDTVDHIDRDGLNNQFHNLRPATLAEQSRNHGVRINNKSGYAGVSWNKQAGKWAAYVTVNSINKFLGYFDDPTAAAAVRDEYTLKHHGEFAFLNFTPTS